MPREGIPIRFVRASGYPGARPSLDLLRFLVNLSSASSRPRHPADVPSRRHRRHRRIRVGAGDVRGRAPPPPAPRRAPESSSTSRTRRRESSTRWSAGLADRVFVTFPETLRSFPVNGLLTGYPLRRRIAAVDREHARAQLDFKIPPWRQVVFVFGGSQGARTINRAIVDALRHLLPMAERLFIIHGTGLFKKGGYHAAKDTDARLAALYSEDERRRIASFYVSRPFFYQIENVYALADLVVARGGAGSLYELASLGLPAIVIPKANLPGDHQVMNARAMARCGGADVIYEEAAVVDGQIVEQVDGRLLAGRDSRPAERRAPARRDGAAEPRVQPARRARAIIGYIAGDGTGSVAGEAAAGAAAKARATTCLPSKPALLARLELRGGAPRRGVRPRGRRAGRRRPRLLRQPGGLAAGERGAGSGVTWA